MAKKTSIEFYGEALHSIRSPDLRKQVYFLYGAENFFIDRLQEEVINLVPAEQRDFNVDLLYGNEVSPGKALGIARSYPMMSERRVLVIRDFRKLQNGSEGDGKLGDFVSYLNQPNPSTILLLIDDRSPDKRTHLGKALTGKSKYIYSRSFEKLPDYKLPDWVSDWVARFWKKRIDPQAAQILSQLVGNDLQLLSNEIEKVCTFVDDAPDISIDDVKKIIGSYREFSVFELKEAVLERNLDKSFSIAEQMLLKSNIDAGEVIRTVGFFYSVFGNIWQVRRLADNGMDKSRVQQEMGISNNWYFNQLWKDAANYHLSEMPQVFEALLDTDRAVKGFSTLDVSTILLLLIKRIVG